MVVVFALEQLVALRLLLQGFTHARRELQLSVVVVVFLPCCVVVVVVIIVAVEVRHSSRRN